MEKVLRFIVLNIFLICFFIFLAYFVKNVIRKRNNQKPQTFIEFLNVGKKLTVKDVSIGLIFGIVFGFLDNFGRFMTEKRLHQKREKTDIGIKSSMSKTPKNGLRIQKIKKFKKFKKF